MNALVMLSGGLDSTVLLAKTLHENYENAGVAAVSFDYGQKHNIELDQAKAIADHYGVYHHIIALPREPFIGGGSALIEGDMPHLTYAELAEAEGPSATYVPFRNANMISQAVALALTTDADAVMYAPHAEDARNWAYPDCTPEFNGAMANAVYVGTYGKVRLLTPFQWMTKAQIVSLGSGFRVPFQLTHSCYEGVRPACGRCPTCIARLAAFERAGCIDPLEYDPATTVNVTA